MMYNEYHVNSIVLLSPYPEIQRTWEILALSTHSEWDGDSGQADGSELWHADRSGGVKPLGSRNIQEYNRIQYNRYQSGQIITTSLFSLTGNHG